jgi:putative MATE family efflux protein
MSPNSELPTPDSLQVSTGYRAIWKMAYPVMVGSIAVTALNITDTIFLGRVSEVALGASALSGVFYFVMTMMGIAIGTGTQIQIARRAGEKNERAIGEIFDHSLIIFFILSLILFSILKFLGPVIFRSVVHSQEIFVASMQFLKYRSFGIFFVMIATSFRSFYVGINSPRVYGWYSAIMALTNILLGYMLIFGNLGFQKLGITGAGIASSIAECTGMLFLFGYTFLKKGIRKFQLFRFEKFNFGIIIKTLNLSAPLVVQNLISMGAWFVFFVFIEKMGEHSLAISNIIRGAYMICMTPIWGFSVASNSMVSNIIGQNRSDEVFRFVKRIIRFAVLVSMLMALITVLFPHWVLNLFTTDQKLIEDSLGCLRMVDLAMVFFAFAIVSISAVSGTGATKAALLIEVAAIIIYLVYNYIVVFQLHLTAEAVWFSEAIYWAFTGIVSFLYLKSGRWKKIRI